MTFSPPRSPRAVRSSLVFPTSHPGQCPVPSLPFVPSPTPVYPPSSVYPRPGFSPHPGLLEPPVPAFPYLLPRSVPRPRPIFRPSPTPVHPPTLVCPRPGVSFLPTQVSPPRPLCLGFSSPPRSTLPTYTRPVLPTYPGLLPSRYFLCPIQDSPAPTVPLSLVLPFPPRYLSHPGPFSGLASRPGLPLTFPPPRPAPPLPVRERRSTGTGERGPWSEGRSWSTGPPSFYSTHRGDVSGPCVAVDNRLWTHGTAPGGT